MSDNNILYYITRSGSSINSTSFKSSWVLLFMSSRREAMQLFAEKIKKLWNGWEIRIVVLLSLLLQVILIAFGGRRKITAKSWIQILVWSAYLMADWVATVALGNLASNLMQGDTENGSPESNNALQTFWAPFLLLHLGGPDTITAYSLEDNELWLRHFLGLVVQVEVAIYVFIQSWSDSALTFIAIPMFIAGIIKYGERTWVLRASSTEQYKEALSSEPDTCQDFIVINPQDLEDRSIAIVPKDGIKREDHNLALAYFLFKRFEFIFVADRNLPVKYWNQSFSVVRHKEARDAFNLIEVELGFLYDVLYTKAIIAYSRLGIFFRCISFISSLSALIVFSVTINNHSKYSPSDISITFLLLVGAVTLEVYAFFLLFFSAWTKIWLIKHEIKEGNPISTTDQLVNRFWRSASRCHSVGINKKWWSGSMGQFNMINFCLKQAQFSCIGVKKLPFVGDFVGKYMNLSKQDVTSDLQEKIFSHLESLQPFESPNIFPVTEKGYSIRKNKRFNIPGIRWSIMDEEFDTSLLIWHIATDLCYYHYLHNVHGDDSSKLDQKCKISKCLSDYMLYLQVFRSSMVPSSVKLVRYKDNCNAAIEFFRKTRDVSDKSTFDGRKSLFEEDLNPETMFLFLQGRGLTRNILKAAPHHPSEEMWETISEVWMEKLVCAAGNCGWKEHAQQLRNGGELLTHVCLLMTHFGLTKQDPGPAIRNLRYTDEIYS